MPDDRLRKTAPVADRPSPSPRRILGALILVFSAWIAWKRAVAVSVAKAFTLDEFQWAHAAWMVSKGEVPYLDFFEVHFPLNYQYMALAFRGAPDDPTAILGMRELMLPVLLLAAWGMWRVNRRDGWDFALLAPILALSLPSWVVRATEIRHDPIGFALFIGCLGFLYTERIPTKVRAFAAGVCLGLACWATQKVLIYGCIFLGAAIADFLAHRTREENTTPTYLLGAPAWFIGGSLTIVVCIVGWLTSHGAWEPFYRWCFEFAADYQRKEASFSWYGKLVPMLRYAWWYFLLAGIGIASTLRRRRESDASDPHATRDLLLLLAWLSTWVSWAVQQAPWSYSAIPFFGMTCIFAGRGAAAIFCSAQGPGHGSAAWVSTTTLTLLYLLAFWRAGQVLERQTRPSDFLDDEALAERYFDDEPQNLLGLPDSALELEFEDPTDDHGGDETEDDDDEDDEPRDSDDEDEAPSNRAERIAQLDDETPKWERFLERPAWAELVEPANEYQLRVLRKVAELTGPEDTCHDNTGTFVARPHAYYFWYTFDTIWKLQRERLIEEVPLSLERSQAVLVLTDTRSGRQPKPLRRWLKRNYRPYNGDIWMNGRTFELKGKKKKITRKFIAMADAEYFVYPEELLLGGELTIDGQRQKKATFKLEAGDHEIEYSGRPLQFSILWLPRNGERWHPNTAAKAHFCCPKTTF